MYRTGQTEYEKENIWLEFINHSSFLLESRKSLIIVDPWVEGSVFVGGWKLLDQSTNNQTFDGIGIISVDTNSVQVTPNSPKY